MSEARRRNVQPAARTTLALVVALQLIAETALTPYWPGLLRDLFGVTDLAATGGYLTVCRIVGLAALPLWGVAARRWPLPRLLLVGLVAAAVCDLTLALAPSLWLFTAASAGSVAASGSLVLAYPALVAALDRVCATDRESVGDRIPAVVLYTAVFHAAAVLATLLGALIVALPQPRIGLLAFVAADLLMAALVWRCVPAGARAGAGSAGSTGGDHRAGPRASVLRPLLWVAVLAVLLDLGTGVGRPFFLELVLSGGGSLVLGAVLFLLPAVAALIVLPWAAALARTRPGGLLPGAALVAAAGLAVQAAGADTLPMLALGRVVFGLGLGAAAVALDLRLFAVVGTRGPGFAAVETARSGALLAAPVLATAAATVALPLPLAVGAVLFLAAAALAGRGPRDRPPARAAATLPGRRRAPPIP